MYLFFDIFIIFPLYVYKLMSISLTRFVSHHSLLSFSLEVCIYVWWVWGMGGVYVCVVGGWC